MDLILLIAVTLLGFSIIMLVLNRGFMVSLTVTVFFIVRVCCSMYVASDGRMSDPPTNGTQLSSPSALSTLSESSTLASSEPSTPATAVKPRSTPNANWVQHFNVNWNEMSDDLMTVLQAKQVPLPKLRREMVRRIVQQIVKITNKPGRQNLKTISAKIVAEWPGCFADRIGDIIIGSGYHSLFTQLENACAIINCLLTF
jgi:hypothetical protein